MALPYHQHNFVLPTATKRDVENATRNDLVVVPNALGSMASKDESQYATAEQGMNADEAKDWIDNTGSGFADAIQQFINNGFPNYVAENAYSVGAYVRYTSGSTGTGVYRSLQDNNTSAPNTNNWERIRAMAFKDMVDISDINAGGAPDDQSYLRGDGAWTSINALVNGPESFVTNPEQPFPEGSDNVVYAMNGAEASTNPGDAHWYVLGTVSSLNINNNPNQFLNGQGNWATIEIETSRIPRKQIWSTAGEYTFTVPANITQVYAKVKGSGGSGSCNSNGSNGNPGIGSSVNFDPNSWEVICNGGGGGIGITGGNQATIPTYTWSGANAIVLSQGENGMTTSASGSRDFTGANGGSGCPLGCGGRGESGGGTPANNATSGQYGGGGGGGGGYTGSDVPGGGGASGAYFEGVLPVTPGMDIRIYVGKGATPPAGSSTRGYPKDGGDGYVILEW